MNAFLKWLLIFLAIAAAALFCYSYFVEDVFDKRLSPKDNVEFKFNDLKMDIFYNRPYKKGREIFGGLVPYDQVWRTGANEATTFKTNKPLLVDGNPIPAGLYTLWTKPNDSLWQVMFNSKQYPWGVDDKMQPMREAEFDILDISVPVDTLDQEVEQFTIGFNNTTGLIKLTMAWDKTKIEIPIEEDLSAQEKK